MDSRMILTIIATIVIVTEFKGTLGLPPHLIISRVRGNQCLTADPVTHSLFLTRCDEKDVLQHWTLDSTGDKFFTLRNEELNKCLSLVGYFARLSSCHHGGPVKLWKKSESWGGPWTKIENKLMAGLCLGFSRRLFFLPLGTRPFFVMSCLNEDHQMWKFRDLDAKNKPKPDKD